MVFEMLGDNLLTLIKYYNYRGIPMALVKRLSRDILEALAFLHAKCRIIHTDLKPENVLLSHTIPRLPKLQRAAYLRFCNAESTSLSQSQSQDKSSGASEQQLSRDEKKKLKKKQKKKQKKQQFKAGTSTTTTDSSNATLAAVAGDATADEDGVEDLRTALSQVEIAAATSDDPHAVLVSNLVVAESLDSESTNVIGSSQNGHHLRTSTSNSTLRRDAGVNEEDDEDDEWVALAPEFTARVMLVLPEGGRVAGSRKKDIEFTITVPPQHVAGSAAGSTAEVRTSFSLRYVRAYSGRASML